MIKAVMLTEPTDVAGFPKHPRMMCTRGTPEMAMAVEANHLAVGRDRATTAMRATASTDETPAISGSTTSRALETTAVITAT